MRERCAPETQSLAHSLRYISCEVTVFSLQIQVRKKCIKVPWLKNKLLTIQNHHVHFIVGFLGFWNILKLNILNFSFYVVSNRKIFAIYKFYKTIYHSLLALLLLMILKYPV